MSVNSAGRRGLVRGGRSQQVRTTNTASREKVLSKRPPHRVSSRGPTLNNPLDVVTVEAQKRRKLIEDQIGQFVSSITLRGREQSLGRSNGRVCFLVAGLPRDGSELIMAHQSQVARDALAQVAPEACNPNFVIVTTEPVYPLEKWWARIPTCSTMPTGLPVQALRPNGSTSTYGFLLQALPPRCCGDVKVIATVALLTSSNG